MRESLRQAMLRRYRVNEKGYYVSEKFSIMVFIANFSIRLSRFVFGEST